MPTIAQITPSPELVAFAQRQLRFAKSRQASTHGRKVDEARSIRRLPLAAPVVLQELDSSLNPIGSPFPAMTRDMSVEGVGLIVEVEPNIRAMHALQVHIDGRDMCFLAELLWCNPLSSYHVVGMRDLSALKSMPQ